MLKNLVKYGLILTVLGICGIYTYKFLAYQFVSVKNTQPDYTNEESGNAAVYQTALPEEIKKKDVGWERVKYAYLPEIEDLEWTNVNSSYAIDHVSFTVTGAQIAKKWNEKWNYEVVRDEYSFDDERKVRGKHSFLSVAIKIRNERDTPYETYINCISLHIYDKEGEKIASKESDTASLDRPYTKSFYRVVLKKHEELEVELLYILPDEKLKDEYYYFLDVNPYSIYPTSKEQIGIFKLPLGLERE